MLHSRLPPQLTSYGCTLTLSSVQPLSFTTTPHPIQRLFPLLLNLWPIYTLSTQKSLLKLHGPLQQATTVSVNPTTHGWADLLALSSLTEGSSRGKFSRCSTTSPSFQTQIVSDIPLWTLQGQFAASAGSEYFGCGVSLGPWAKVFFLYHRNTGKRFIITFVCWVSRWNSYVIWGRTLKASKCLTYLMVSQGFVTFMYFISALIWHRIIVVVVMRVLLLAL